MITPTVGRVLWYWPSLYDLSQMRQMNVDQPFRAHVDYVHNDRKVNLTVTDHYGQRHFRQLATLKQEGDRMQPGAAYAEWMPYQVGQAKASAAPAPEPPPAPAPTSNNTLHLPKKKP
jgi:hypothetical protein